MILIFLKQEMGLIAAPKSEKPKQLESGDDDVEAPEVAEGSDGVAPAAESAKPAEPIIHEAQLIKEFDEMEKSD